MAGKGNVQLEFGDELMRQIGVVSALPDNMDSKDIKFDAKGSVHVMCRDGDGKLLKDVPINDKLCKKIDHGEERDQMLTMQEETKMRARMYNRMFIIIVILLVIILCLAVYITRYAYVY